jgi:hypothetical protein
MAIQRRTFQSPVTVSETAPEAVGEPADESIETGAVDVTPAADSALAKARAAMASNDADIARLVAERNAALLADEVDEADVERLDGELARHQRRAKTLADRLSLLAAEEQREAAARAIQAREAKIVETEHLFVARDAAVADLRDHLVAAEAAFRRIHELNLAARAAWPWDHGRVGGTLTAASDLVRETASFLYRISGRAPQTGGEFRPDVPPSLPGGKCPRIEWLQTPDRLPDLAAQYRLASKYASDVMRGARGDVPAPASPASPGVASPGDSAPSNIAQLPTISPIHAAPNPELARLLSRQNQLASRDMTPDEELEYQNNGKLVQQLSA